MSVEWFCQLMGSELGPLSSSELVQMVRQQQVTAEDLVRRGNSAWVPAYQVKGLFEAAAAKTAPDETADASSSSEHPRVGTQQQPSQLRASVDFKSRRVDVAATNDTPASAALPTRDPAAAGDWFCICEGTKIGPMSFEQLQVIANSGKLHRRDRVWRASAPKWSEAGAIAGLQVFAE